MPTKTKKSPLANPANRGRGGKPLAYYERQFVIQMGVLGNSRQQIANKFLEKYGRTINLRTVTRIWKESRDEMDEAQKAIQNQGLTIVTGDALKQKSYNVLNRRLERAEKDESEIEKLRIKLRAGEITLSDFNRDCAKYEQLTINELVKVADMGFVHSQKNGEGPALTPEDQAALAVLTEGLKNGNPLQLIQVLNPTINQAAPTAGTPVH
jgi:hypothetical protein